MICRQCEESVNGTGCTKNGVCGKNAELADRQDVLVGVLMDISTSYGKDVDSESAPGIDALIVDGLFSTLTNTNFDIESINSYISEGEKLLSDIGGTRSEDFTIPSLDDNEDLRSLKELLLYGVKGLAAYYHHAYVLGGRDDSITDFIIKCSDIWHIFKVYFICSKFTRKWTCSTCPWFTINKCVNYVFRNYK